MKPVQHLYSINTLAELLRRGGLLVVRHRKTVANEKRSYVQTLATHSFNCSLPSDHPFNVPDEISGTIVQPWWVWVR